MTAVTDQNDGLHEQAVSDAVIELIATKMREMAMPHVAKAVESRQTQIFAFQLTVEDRESYLEARVVGSGDNDALVMVRDITAQIHDDEARQNSLLLSDLYNRVRNLRSTLRSTNSGDRESPLGDPPSRQESVSVPFQWNAINSGMKESPDGDGVESDTVGRPA